MSEPTTITVRRTNVPARKLPAGLWIDVLDVLKAHGLEPTPGEIVQALTELVNHTPASLGGRLQPDGRISIADDYPDLHDRWYCGDCRKDFNEPEHDCMMRPVGQR